MANSNFSQRDEYGFERPENFDYQTYDYFMSKYLKILTRRAQRWDSAFRARNFKKSNTLKRFCRKGIPSSLRPSCWLVISGADTIRRSGLSYEELKKKKGNAQLVESIKIDLPRTFPDNIFFSNEQDHSIPSTLYNVLVTFAQQNVEVGYCQGLNYIAGLILLATKDEATTFWLLKTLVEQILPKYYIKTMSGLLTDLDVLNELVQEKEPTVHRHILNIGMPWAMGTTKWFICCYADVLPPETVLRIWDCLFYEGSKIIFRVALTLIKLHKEDILGTSDLSELMIVFKSMRNHPGVIDCHVFIDAIFKLPGSLSNSKIEKLRTKYAK